MPQSQGGESRGAPPYRGKRVLVADPDETNLELLRKALASKGCEVGVTTSAVGALDMLRIDEYHLIIAEASMPDLDGFTLFETARYDARTGRIPFIFLTADAAPESRQRAVELGADGYLVKPVPAKELFRLCEDTLRRFDTSVEGVGAWDLAGSIGTFAVEEIVQILQAGGKSGHLVITTPKAIADIFFEKGNIFNANFAGIEGDEAIYLIFAVKEAHFTFRSGVRAQVRNVTANVSSLLLEGMRRMDEAREAVMGYTEGRKEPTGTLKVGQSDESTVPMEMKPVTPVEAEPAAVQGAGVPESEGDFAVSFDESPLEAAGPSAVEPEVEPLPGHGRRLAGAPPRPGPKAAPAGRKPPPPAPKAPPARPVRKAPPAKAPPPQRGRDPGRRGRK